jgi:hypothetical protein
MYPWTHRGFFSPLFWSAPAIMLPLLILGRTDAELFFCLVSRLSASGALAHYLKVCQRHTNSMVASAWNGNGLF